MKKHIITADTETFDGLNGCSFACGCIYNGSQVYTFTNETEFCETLLRYEYPRYIIYFHNASFDIRFLLQYCLENHIPFPAPVIRGSLYLSQLFPSLKNKKPITSNNILLDKETIYTKIQDSYALLPISLSQFEKVFSLNEHKLEMDFEKTNDLSLYIKRCQSDVKILYDGLIKLFELFPTTKRSLSLPQASMKDFMKNCENFMFTTKGDFTNGITVETEKEDDARKGYHGGRNEIFKYSLFDKINYYDINSLYPYVMKNNVFPINISETKPTKNVIKEDLYYVYADIYLPYVYIPPAPLKMDKLYFTYGKMRGWFYSPEFNIIKDMCEKVEIIKAYTFTPTQLFKEYINKYWNMRNIYIKEKNPLQKVVKLYMNSLYGKFGQKRECDNRMYIYDIEEGCDEISDGIYTKTTKSYSKAKFINPFISGFITSYARAYLYKFLDEDSIYCDTDSIITTKQINNIGNELGQFKLEGQGTFQAFSPKTYFFIDEKKGSQCKAKGVYKEYIKGDTPEEFLTNIRRTEKDIYAKPRESIRRFGSFLSTKHITKEISLINNKRIILENKDTKPYQACDIISRNI